ncbi:hypothetical protein [Pseudomonas aeruginosa]|nr:hypothetical protein [Pseudomonas aeruginosa]
MNELTLMTIESCDVSGVIGCVAHHIDIGKPATIACAPLCGCVGR